MAILDNSGDIILDCVLTEKGRKRLSTGNFSISKFALGDDEIDYALYQKNHASGSAYYDLQILQTPILEAFTQRNASINYGLMTINNNNLLYMPTIKRNTKIAGTCLFDKHNVIYVAVSDGTTYDTLVTLFGGTQGGGANYVLEAGATTGPNVVFETGLDTAAIPATPANKQNYIVGQGLQDASFQVSVDNRFVSSVQGPGQNSQFNNNGGNGQAVVNFNMAPRMLTGQDTMVANHSVTTITALDNNVYFRTNDSRKDTETSAIAGPRSNATALSFGVRPLNADMFARYGSVGQTLAGDSSGNTYSYIDSVVFLRAQYTEHQFTIRIIKKD